MLKKATRFGTCLLIACCAVCLLAFAQQAAPGAVSAVVPLLINYSGILTGSNGKPLTGTVGATFSLYKDQEGSSPLWVETQNVQLDKTGHFSVQLGATSSQGLPPSLFAGGEARWLGVLAQGEAEQPRTLLMSVPYAMKALDAETIGGKPLSALQLALPAGGSQSASPNSAAANTITCSSSSACKSGYVPVFASNGGAAKVKDSIIQQSGSTISIAGNENLTGPISASATTTSAAVTGSDNTSGGAWGVSGASSNGIGVIGTGVYGLYGTGEGEDGYGVYAIGNTGVFGNGNAVGVEGISTGSTGVAGVSTNYYGVVGQGGAGGMYAITTGGSGTPGLYAQASYGWAVDAYSTETGTGVLAGSYSGYGGWFNGPVQVEGSFYVSGQKDFKIDHPADPANKYLLHSSVESSEMMNIYTGNVTTDAQGEATVRLPDWFEALNTGFRYQLTVIGQFAQAIVAHEIQEHEFQIKTNLPNVKVSWLVTGVRHDAYATAHPLQVEEDKPERERGFYFHPELYGAPEEKGILWARDPKAMQQWKQARTNPLVSNPKTDIQVPVKP